MPELTSILSLAAIGAIAGFINIMAGGGSALTMPALIFLGLDAATANGTNRIAILLQSIVAVITFKKGKYSQFKLSIKMAFMTLPGGIIGAWAAVTISQELFKILLGLVMIGVVASMLIPRKSTTFESPKTNPQWTIYIAMLAIGFYGGFMQAGVGFFLMAAMHYILRITLVRINMHKVFIVLLYTIPALSIFIYFGNVDFSLGIALAIGNATGGWLAVRLQIRKGDKIIRHVLIAAILIMAAKLLGIF